MAFSFPASPSVGDTSTQNGRVYTWSGVTWQFAGSIPATFATTTAGFPATGNLNYIYCATDTNRFYRWTGSVYVEIGPVGSTNASDMTTGTVSDTLLSSKTRAALNLYLWSTLR